MYWLVYPSMDSPTEEASCVTKGSPTIQTPTFLSMIANAKKKIKHRTKLEEED